jgi:conjugative transfer pilus assembly protein TraH
MFKKRLIASIIAFTFSASANADVQSDMQSWFNDIGVYGNLTGAQVLNGQTGTTFTGGNLYMRMPQRNYQLMNVALPSAKAGCGGIDLFAGSFSFINAEQLTAMLRNMANNAIGVAFQLAIESVSPELSDIMKWAQDLASKANNMSLNSCQMAQGLVKAAWPDALQSEQVKTKMGKMPDLNMATDSFQAFWKTLTDGPSTNQAENSQIAQQDPGTKASMVPTNVVWEALKRMTNADDQIKLLMMSMTGTVTIEPINGDNPNAKPKITYVPPPEKIDFKDFIGDPAQPGKQINIFACGDDDCMNIGTQTATALSFSKYAHDRIASIISKVQARQSQSLTSQEYAILQGTNIPLWKLISLTSAGPAAESMIDMASQAIAIDMAYTYFNEMSKELEKTVSGSRGISSTVAAEQLKEFRERAFNVRQEAHAMLAAELKKVTAFAEMQQAVAMLNEEIKRGMSPQTRLSLDTFSNR